MLIKKKNLLTYSAASMSIIMWASAFPAVKYSLAFYSPASITLFRFIVASLVLLLIALRQKIRLPDKVDLPYFAAGGFIGIFSYMWLFNAGTGMMQSGVSSFIIASAPVFTLLLSIFVLKEKAGLFVWLGVLISTSGLILIASSQASGFKINPGVFLLVLAAICTGTYNIIQRKILRKYNPMEATLYTVFFGTGFAMVFLPGLLREFSLAPLAVDMIVVYMGIFPAAFAYLLWGYALYNAEKTSSVVMFLYLTPFVAMVIADVWLGEKMPTLAFLGGLVIISGMVLSTKKAS